MNFGQIDVLNDMIDHFYFGTLIGFGVLCLVRAENGRFLFLTSAAQPNLRISWE
jgi:hypothetical protein